MMSRRKGFKIVYQVFLSMSKNRDLPNSKFSRTEEPIMYVINLYEYDTYSLQYLYVQFAFSSFNLQ